MGRRFVRTGPTKSIGKKEIFEENQAIEQYPDSFHLRGPRAISAEVPEEKILNYELAQIAGLDVLHLISEPTDGLPCNPEPTVFKDGNPVFLLSSNPQCGFNVECKICDAGRKSI